MLTTHTPLRLLLVAVLALVPLTGLAGAAGSAEAASAQAAQGSDDNDGVDLTVTVAQPTQSPRPEASCELPYGKPAGHAEVRVRVRHLKPNSLAQAHVHSTPALLASGNAGADGSIVLTGTLPDDLAAGSHSISVTGVALDGLPFTQTVLTFTVTAGGLLAAGPETPTVASRTAVTTAVGVVQTTVTTPAEAATLLGTDAFGLGGVLTVSGLTVRASPALSPGGGEAILDFTIRNLSTVPITSSLKFWIDNALGIPIASRADVAVADLTPGETRTIAVTLGDVGQWTVFNGHVTLTPPATVAGTALTPISRDAIIIVPPYFLILVSLLVVGLSDAVRFVLRARRDASVATHAVVS